MFDAIGPDALELQAGAQLQAKVAGRHKWSQ